MMSNQRIKKARQAIQKMNTQELNAAQEMIDQRRAELDQADSRQLVVSDSTIFTRTEVNEIVKNRDLLYMQYLHKAQDELFMPLLMLALEYETLLADIDYNAAALRGDELSKVINQQTIGELGDIIARLHSQSHLMTGQPLPKRIAHRANVRVQAIQCMLENNDDGANLREVIQDRDATTVITEWRDSIKQIGRPTGVSDWKIELRKRWLEYESQNPDAAPADVRMALLDKLCDGGRARQTLRDGVTDAEKTIYNKLISTTATRRPDKFRANLLS